MQAHHIVTLTEEQVSALEASLADYDRSHHAEGLGGGVSIGMAEEGRIVAGLDASMSAFHILYVSTVFVAEDHRRQGLGRALMAEMEERARALGASIIRLDTFDWQGRDFYRALGYEQVGQYDVPEDGFSEYFFLKRL